MSLNATRVCCLCWFCAVVVGGFLPGDFRGGLSLLVLCEILLAFFLLFGQNVCLSVVLHNNQRHIRTCVCVVCFGVYILLVFYEQQRDRSLVSVCVCVWFVYWWYWLLSVSVVFFFSFYLFSVSLITTQLKHQSSYSRTMFMYISASFKFIFSLSVHALKHELASGVSRVPVV